MLLQRRIQMFSKKTINSKFRNKLMKIGFSGHQFTQIVGRGYMFQGVYAGKQSIIFGKILAVEFSDGVLEFFVSSPYFGGRNLLSILRLNDKWMPGFETKPELDEAEFTDLHCQFDLL